MKRVLNAVLGGCLLVASCAAPKKDTITIKGKVQFPDNQFNMEIVERNGFDKTIMHKGEAALRAEFERLLPAIRSGGYIPAVDHQTPPDVSLENYHTYMRLFQEYGALK